MSKAKTTFIITDGLSEENISYIRSSMRGKYRITRDDSNRYLVHVRDYNDILFMKLAGYGKNYFLYNDAGKKYKAIWGSVTYAFKV